jgi:hypothetical protein
MAQEKKLFRLWRRVRDGKLSRKEFRFLVLLIRNRLQEILIDISRKDFLLACNKG